MSTHTEVGSIFGDHPDMGIHPSVATQLEMARQERHLLRHPIGSSQFWNELQKRYEGTDGAGTGNNFQLSPQQLGFCFVD